ncbi:methyltransferase family protein [Aeropyrum camini]|uniref:Uncharacterized protein n=1 Tax=Aeropyrum camini SY1 = JCM 12091 TaxID=1198449 RepID=U3T934_9CREN|nr:isoprenylcysteine carboxylmethyltransferase family protein [Aeropyrum camini]BAN90032.1 putative protein-S-isoprenylcysteine methyltransferase [Aeropyrum camini SY1 = JCM 12091]
MTVSREIKAGVMTLLILAFLAVLALVSRWIWVSVLGFHPGPLHPALAVVGGFIVGLGVAELLYTYIYFSPILMLSNTMDDILDIVAGMFMGRPPWRPTAPGGCKDYRIVAEGPYRCVRHPVYTAALTAFLGATLVKHYFLLASILLSIAYILLSAAEEARLNAKTCGRYKEIMAGKPSISPLGLLRCMLRDIAGVGNASSQHSPTGSLTSPLPRDMRRHAAIPVGM